MIEPNKHQKHAKLAKPDFGNFHTNEWAFIGTSCSTIKSIVQQLSGMLSVEAKSVYMDESHNHQSGAKSFSYVLKHAESFEVFQSNDWNQSSNRALIRNADICFINGNHFNGKKQIVFLDPIKKESLSRKLDRLTDVRCFIYTDKVKKPYAFLKTHLPNWKEIPSFHEYDYDGLYNFIKKDFIVPPLKSLILAGGKSKRMGQDKGRINYHGKDQRSYLYELMHEFTDEVYISCRKDQVEELKDFKVVEDKFLGLGPFGAIA